ncbi:hypothetical protein AAXE64_27030 [Priestia megaterium]
MKLIKRKEFLKLPSGVMYSEFYSTNVFSGLYIKKESLNNDWCFESLIDQVKGSSLSEDISEAVFDSISKKTSFELDLNRIQSNGDFENNQFFAVYEKDDIDALVKKLINITDQYPKF